MAVFLWRGKVYGGWLLSHQKSFQGIVLASAHRFNKHIDTSGKCKRSAELVSCVGCKARKRSDSQYNRTVWASPDPGLEVYRVNQVLEVE